MRRDDNFTILTCRLSPHLGASTSWNPWGQSRPVTGTVVPCTHLLNEKPPKLFFSPLDELDLGSHCSTINFGPAHFAKHYSGDRIRKEWAGHVARMAEKTGAYRVLVGDT